MKTISSPSANRQLKTTCSAHLLRCSVLVLTCPAPQSAARADPPLLVVDLSHLRRLLDGAQEVATVELEEASPETRARRPRLKPANLESMI